MFDNANKNMCSETIGDVSWQCLIMLRMRSEAIGDVSWQCLIMLTNTCVLSWGCAMAMCNNTKNTCVLQLFTCLARTGRAGKVNFL